MKIGELRYYSSLILVISLIISNLKSTNQGFHFVGWSFYLNNMGTNGKLRSSRFQKLLGQCKAMHLTLWAHLKPKDIEDTEGVQEVAISLKIFTKTNTCPLPQPWGQKEYLGDLGAIYLQASSEAEADSELAWLYRPIYQLGITGQLRGRFRGQFRSRFMTGQLRGRFRGQFRRASAFWNIYSVLQARRGCNYRDIPYQSRWVLYTGQLYLSQRLQSCYCQGLRTTLSRLALRFFRHSPFHEQIKWRFHYETCFYVTMLLLNVQSGTNLHSFSLLNLPGLLYFPQFFTFTYLSTQRHTHPVSLGFYLVPLGFLIAG